MWFYDQESKATSKCAEFLNSEKNQEKWRNSYWEQGYKFLTTKTDDWEYEKECRLISYSTIGGNIKLSKYDFNSLEGIIFGIKTKDEHKMKILEIIEEKCRKSNRKDFKFYQSEYCHQNGKIEKKELTLKLKG